MVQIQGYYDGTACILLEEGKLRANQKVLITVLDEEIQSYPRRLGTLEGEATVAFAEDWEISDEEFVAV